MSKEHRFWDWFLQNNSRYLLLNQLEDANLKEDLLNEFLEHLHAYSEHLYFEIGGSPNETQELVITAEGKREYFGEVETLIDKAPSIPGWKWIAFKQPAGSLFITKYEGLVVDPKSMWFLPLSNDMDPRALGLKVCLKSYAEEHRDVFVRAVFKVLDTLLGEKSTALNVQYLDVDKLPINPEENCLIELIDLPEYISWRKNKL